MIDTVSISSNSLNLSETSNQAYDTYSLQNPETIKATIRNVINRKQYERKTYLVHQEVRKKRVSRIENHWNGFSCECAAFVFLIFVSVTETHI